MKRVNCLLSSAFYQDYLGRNDEKEREREFCRHNPQHFMDVARITYILLLESRGYIKIEEFSKELVYATALLHDIGRWQQYETGEDHALVGARLAVPILVEAGFSLLEQELICQAITEHRSGCTPQTILGSALKRADKLSRLCKQCTTKERCNKLAGMETAEWQLIY